MDIKTTFVYLMFNYELVVDKKYMSDIIHNNTGRRDERLASVITETCNKYKFNNKDCAIYNNILFAESSYRLNMVNKKTKDYCMAQINHTHKVDKQKALTNLQYCLEEGIKILSYFKRRFKKSEAHWFGRYNCGTRSSCLSRPKTKKYINKILSGIIAHKKEDKKILATNP